MRSSFSSNWDSASSIGFFILQGKGSVGAGGTAAGRARAGVGELTCRPAAQCAEDCSCLEGGAKRKGENPGDWLGRPALGTEKNEDLIAADRGDSGTGAESNNPRNPPGGRAGAQGRARSSGLKPSLRPFIPVKGAGPKAVTDPTTALIGPRLPAQLAARGARVLWKGAGGPPGCGVLPGDPIPDAGSPLALATQPLAFSNWSFRAVAEALQGKSFCTCLNWAHAGHFEKVFGGKVPSGEISEPNLLPLKGWIPRDLGLLKCLHFLCEGCASPKHADSFLNSPGDLVPCAAGLRPPFYMPESFLLSAGARVA